MADMIIKIDLFSIKGKAMGNTSIGLDWMVHENNAGPNVNEWGIWDFNGMHHQIVWGEADGLFDNKSWDVMWLWVRDEHKRWRNVFILWDPPTSRYDSRHKSGGGRTYDAKNPAFGRLPLKWKVEYAECCS